MLHDPQRRGLSALCATLLMGGALAALPATAHAATITPTITNFAVTPTSGSAWRAITTSFDWCAPDGSGPGDSFTVGLPDLLGSWPSSFPLTSSDGTVVANGTVNAGPPSTLTVTLAAATAGQHNVCGTASMSSTVRDQLSALGTTKTLTYTVGGKTFTTDVTFTPRISSSVPSKWISFAKADQCRTDGSDCLLYGVLSQLGPTTQDVVVDDPAKPGQQFDCSRLVFQWADATGASVRGMGTTEYTVDSCTPTALRVTIHGLPDQLRAKVTWSGSVDASVVGGVTYTNDATVTTGGVAVPVTTQVISNQASGTGTFSGIQVRKDDVHGNAADTAATRVVLPNGSTGIVVTVTNRGVSALHDVVVSDATTAGTGRLTGLSCNFSAAAGAPTTGVRWAGPWPVGTSFTCTGTLSGVTEAGHTDVASVAALDALGHPVSGDNPYHAVRPVRYNLRLAKKLVSAGPFQPGQLVTYTLTPSNDGPSTARAGWTVTDLPAAGLTVTRMSGTGYSCTVATRTCTSSRPLPTGKGQPVTVVARIAASATGVLPNVAYVKPVKGDAPETNPLGSTPTAATNPERTPTDNDAWAKLTVSRTYLYLVQADRYRTDVSGSAGATRANRKLVASLDDDGVLRYREDMGTLCSRRNAPTCLWYRTDSAVVRVSVTSTTKPNPAQVMAAYNRVAPARTGKVSSTARMTSVSGTTTVAWVLGAGATASQPWGARGTVPQVFLAHS